MKLDDYFFVEQCHGDKAMNTFCYDDLDKAMSAYEIILLYYGNCRIFKMVEGEQVDLA